MTASPSTLRVAVCGAGTMGGGIAMLAALAGAEVAVLDTNSASLESGRMRVEAELRRMETKGRLGTMADAVISRLAWTGDLQELGRRDLVIEAIVERLDAKLDLLTALEAIIGDEAILASNTSSLSIAQLASSLAHPRRFLGMHFFNPATAMKLVEVVSGPDTDPDVVASVEETARGWGKIPIRVADVPGFVVNRVARPYYAEGFRAWQEGIEPELVDHLFRAGAGFRMGPLELSDLIGQDVNFAVARSVYDAYFGVTRFVPQRAQAALVDGGRLGRKSGIGVYDYRPGSHGGGITPSATAASCDREGPVALGAVIHDAPDLLVMVTRGVTAAAEAGDAGRPVALIDWCAEGCTVVGVSIGGAIDYDAAVSVIARLGYAPHRLPDRPGLLVARTLAQIANAAADALLERVSDAAGIDAALRFGANYPFGPVQWADSQPQGTVAALLAEIAKTTGQAMYLPSEGWARR